MDSRAWSRASRAGGHQLRPRVALLSNPRSTGNIAQLPRIREYCAEHPDIFHYEVEHASQIGEAMKVIARIQPKVLAINGGDGTVQAALTELYNGGHFGDEPPPVAVLPSGKTNLIAFDLGARSDPIETLERLIELARTDLKPHTVARELIALRHGDGRATAGDRHVPGRRRACRHDALLPRQDLSAGPAQRLRSRADRDRLPDEGLPGDEGELPAARSQAAAGLGP